MPSKLTPEKQTAFLAALAETCRVDKACKAVDISRVTAFKWRRDDPKFAAAWAEATRIGVTALEDEAHRRGFEGVQEPVFQGGDHVGSIRKYSDTLAIFLLKAHAPQKYRERQSIDLNANVAHIDVDDRDRAERLSQLLARVAQRSADDDGSDLV